MWKTCPRRSVAPVVLLCLVAATVRVRGQAPDVLFEDAFAEVDPAFGPADAMLSVDNGVLTKKLGVNEWWRALYASMLFEDADVTVKVQLPDLTTEQGSGVGLIFWALSVDDMYVLEIGDSGTFAVRRFSPDRYLYPILWRASDAINLEPGAWNELRVVTRGDRATIYINGKEQGTIKGRPPDSGSQIGLFAETDEGAADEGRFSALKVVALQSPRARDSAEDPSVLLSDDFATLDPGWGVESGTFGVRNGKLFVAVEAGNTSTTLYQGDILSGDIDATIRAHVNDGADADDSAAAMIFWANGYDDYWAYTVFDDGTIGVGHWLKTRWLWPMKIKAIPGEVNFDPDGFTQLRIVAEGRRATFYANGVDLGSVSGQPPADGSYLGVFVEAGGHGVTAELDDLLVKKP